MGVENGLKIYAIVSAHFIMASIREWLGRINSIILFGSVAQGTGTKSSDVDIFFDTDISEKQRIKLRSNIRKAISQFRLSQEALKFKMRGVCNEINFFIGKLDDWEDLQRSIAATGIVLYGRYTKITSKSGLKHYLLIFWEGAGKRRGAFLNKLYGYKVKGTRYKGLIQRCRGIKIGKSAAMINIAYKDRFFETLEEYGINYKVIEVFGY